MMKVAWLSGGSQLPIYQSFRMPVSFSTPSVELLHALSLHIEITLANDVRRWELTRVLWLRAISLSATRDVKFMQQCLGIVNQFAPSCASRAVSKLAALTQVLITLSSPRLSQLARAT